MEDGSLFFTPEVFNFMFNEKWEYRNALNINAGERSMDNNY